MKSLSLKRDAQSRQLGAVRRDLKSVAVLFVGVGLIVASGAVTARANDHQDANHERVAALITQLGSDLFAEREAATSALQTIGEPATHNARDNAIP